MFSVCARRRAVVFLFYNRILCSPRSYSESLPERARQVREACRGRVLCRGRVARLLEVLGVLPGGRLPAARRRHGRKENEGDLYAEEEGIGRAPSLSQSLHSHSFYGRNKYSHIGGREEGGRWVAAPLSLPLPFLLFLFLRRGSLRLLPSLCCCFLHSFVRSSLFLGVF